MGCRPILDEKSQVRAIACSRGSRRQRCSACQRNSATQLCDGPNPERESKTCDAPLCRLCAVRHAGKDYCVTCADAIERPVTARVP